jgi:hypothetical protein
MRGKCNCGKPATCEYLIKSRLKQTNYATTIKLCANCKPKYEHKGMSLLDGK